MENLARELQKVIFYFPSSKIADCAHRTINDFGCAPIPLAISGYLTFTQEDSKRLAQCVEEAQEEVCRTSRVRVVA